MDRNDNKKDQEQKKYSGNTQTADEQNKDQGGEKNKHDSEADKIGKFDA